MSIFTTHNRIFVSLILASLLGAGCSDQGTQTPAQSESKDAATTMTQEPEVSQTSTEAQPDATMETAQDAAPSEAASSSTGPMVADGLKIFQTTCQVCHATGVAGAPKLGDKDAWAPRIAKGTDALFSSVKNGLNAMPPKGTCMSCSDDELRAAMEYMIEQGS